MRPLVLASCGGAVVAGMVFVARAQNAPGAGGRNAGRPPRRERSRRRARADAAPGADPYANNAAPGTQTFPLAAQGRRGQQRAHGGAAGRGQPGALRSGQLEVRHRVRSAAGLEDLEPREAEDDAGRQGDGRHVLRCRRRLHLLRHGQRRLRLHLDRDAARPARLGNGRADLAHLPAREGGAGRARRLRRRARDPARARRRRARHRRADGRHGGRGDRGAQLDLLPAARPAQQRRRPGLRRQHVGRRARRLPPDRSTTTSCSS